MTTADLIDEIVNDPQVREACFKLVQDYPPSAQVIHQLLLSLSSQSFVNKKRKLDTTLFDSTTTATTTTTTTSKTSGIVAKIENLKFQIPRKKVDLIVEKNAFLVDDLRIPFDELSTNPLLLPMPANPSKSNLVVIGKSGAHFLVSFPSLSPSLTFSPGFNNHDISSSTPTSTSISSSSSSSNVNVLKSILVKLNIHPKEPKETDFLSKFPETHGIGKIAKSTTQLYASCYLKAKDGHLFFLDTGIFYGFKKPLIFLHLKQVVSAQVDCLTTRTFNLKISYRPSHSELLSYLGMFVKNKKKKKVDDDDEDELLELEFDMIDNCEFDPIMSYLSKYQISSLDHYNSDDIHMQDTLTLKQDAPVNNLDLFQEDLEYNEEEDQDYQTDETDETDDDETGTDETDE